MVITKAIPAEICVAGFQLLFRYHGQPPTCFACQPPTCFACQEVGHTAKDCPKLQKRRDKGRNQSKPAQVKNSLKEPVKPGSSKSGSSASSSHLRDLREQLDFLKRTFTPSVVSGEGTVSSQPTSPPVVVVEAVPVATSSSPGVRQPDAVASLQQDSFEFSLEVPPADTVVPSSSSGWSQQFHRSVRCKGNDSLEIVVPSSASCLGPNNNTNNKHTNKLTKSTSPHTKAGGTSSKSNKSSKQAKPAAKSLSKLARGVGVKSVRASSSSSSSSASEDEDNIPLRRRSKKLRKMSLPPTLSSGVPPSGVAQVLPSPAVTPAPAEVMEEDIDACLAGDSVVDPVVVEESVPAVAVAEPHAAPALMDEASAPPRLLWWMTMLLRRIVLLGLSPPHSLSLVHILTIHWHFSRMVPWVLFLRSSVMWVHLRHARLLAIRLVLIGSRSSYWTCPLGQQLPMLNLLSLNINGLNDRIKRTALVDWLKCMKVDVACLQETHAPSHESIRKWFANSGFRVVSSSVSNKRCGTAILIKDCFKVKQVIRDDAGRFVQVSVDFDDDQLSFISLYAPNRNPDRNTFFSSLSGLIDLTRPTFVCGDFNSVLDNDGDRPLPSLALRGVYGRVVLSLLFCMFYRLRFWLLTSAQHLE